VFCFKPCFPNASSGEKLELDKIILLKHLFEVGGSKTVRFCRPKIMVRQASQGSFWLLLKTIGHSKSMGRNFDKYSGLWNRIQSRDTREKRTCKQTRSEPGDLF
jgi:hypothetical protein